MDKNNIITKIKVATNDILKSLIMENVQSTKVVKYSEILKPVDQAKRTVPKNIEKYIEIKKEVITSDIFKVNTPTSKILKVNHNSQRNNKYSPNSACNVTSMQMQFDPYYRITDDELWILCNSEEIKNIVKNKHANNWSWIKGFFDSKRANEVLVVLEEVAVKLLGKEYVYLDWSTSLDEIKREISLGYSVTLLTKLAGGGHFIDIIGYDDDRKVMISNDSWGNWNMNYRGKGGLNGEGVEYSYSLWDKGLVVKYGAYYIHADKKVPV